MLEETCIHDTCNIKENVRQTRRVSIMGGNWLALGVNVGKYIATRMDAAYYEWAGYSGILKQEDTFN